jgi:hypothetical protein
MDKTTRNIIIVLAVLIILTPLGLIATGETFGEWSNEAIKEKFGYVPPGLEGLSGVWSAPMPDYGIPGLEGTSVGAAAGYVLSAVVGVVVCVGALYLFGKLVAKNDTE